MKYVSFPLLPKGGVMVIGAPAKAKKSWLAMNLAYALAEGTQFLKWKIEGGQQKVLYVEQEIGKFGVKERFSRIHNHYGGFAAEDNIIVATKGGKIPYSLESTTPGFHNLKVLIEEQRPDVIILDPLREFHLKEEDSSTEMTEIFKAVTELQKDETGEMTGRSIVLVHHTGKRSEFRDSSSPESLRGSSKIFDAGDSYIMMEPNKGNDNNIRLTFKLRHAAAPEPLNISFDGDSGIFKVVSRQPATET